MLVLLLVTTMTFARATLGVLRHYPNAHRSLTQIRFWAPGFPSFSVPILRVQYKRRIASKGNDKRRCIAFQAAIGEFL